MNTAAKKKRYSYLKNSVLQAAAAILRNRLVIVESPLAAKLYMESASKSGFRCRIAHVDFTQHASLVAKGALSKVLCTQPSASLQKEPADKILGLPMTSIIGTTLVRSGGVTLEAFIEKLSSSYGRPRSMFVSISMPPSFLKHIKSASKCALGPLMDVHERSGIEYSMRMIGAKSTSTEDSIVIEDAEDDAEEEEIDDDHEVNAEAEGSLETMTREGVKKAFGREALFMLGTMFQHSSNICEEGEFLNPKSLIQFTSEKAIIRHY